MEISPAMPPRVAAPETSVAVQKPGKSGQAVGQLAKNAVAAAKAAGIDLPANARGLAASQIAKGVDPASIFAAQVVTPTEVVEETDASDPMSAESESSVDQAGVAEDPVANASDFEPADEQTLAVDAAIMFQSSLSVLTLAGDTSSQNALDLLS